MSVGKRAAMLAVMMVAMLAETMAAMRVEKMAVYLDVWLVGTLAE